MQELTSTIKSTRIPIICIANDASTPKMKTLKNYCECITWKRVPAAQIAPRMMEICKKEGLQIDRQSVEKIAESTHGDIRQILNFLQMWRKGKSAACESAHREREILATGKERISDSHSLSFFSLFFVFFVFPSLDLDRFRSSEATYRYIRQGFRLRRLRRRSPTVPPCASLYPWPEKRLDRRPAKFVFCRCRYHSTLRC